MFWVTDLAASHQLRVRVPSLHTGALQEQGPWQQQDSAARAAEWSRGRPAWGGRERGLAMVLLPVSISLCPSSRNLIYLKIWMLSKWYTWLAFSPWIMWRRLLTSWWNAGLGGGCRWCCTVTLAFVPWHSHWGLWMDGYRHLLFSGWQDAAEW